MRPLSLTLAILASLTFVSLASEPAQAAGICADDRGSDGDQDLYNNMGGPGSECDGVVCVGYTMGQWQTCVPPAIHCVTAPCPVAATSAAAVGPPPLCVGDVYNNQAGQPSSGCDGIVCQGFSDGQWHRCVLDCTTCAAPAASASAPIAVCVIGDAYNTGGSRCEGVVCTGWDQWGWRTCYPELGPCWPTCPPPPKDLLA